MEDVFAYIVAVTSHPAFTAKFAEDLAKPGIRVPFTDDADLFFEAVELGRMVVWTQTFGERFVDPAKGRPSRSPRLSPAVAPRVPTGGTIGQSGEMPEEMHYDAASRRLHVGDGHIDGVPAEAAAYEVSGMNVIEQWFSYRNARRERPQHERRDSVLSKRGPERWPHEYTSELLDLINVLGRLVEMEPAQANILGRVCSGKTISVDELCGTVGTTDVKPKKPRTSRRPAPEQATLPNVPTGYRLTPSKPGRKK